MDFHPVCIDKRFTVWGEIKKGPIKKLNGSQAKLVLTYCAFFSEKKCPS